MKKSNLFRKELLIALSLILIGLPIVAAARSQIKTKSQNSVFINSNNLVTHGKPMMLIFSSKSCSYCRRQINDIVDSSKLSTKIKKFSAYIIPFGIIKKLTFLHQGKMIRTNSLLLGNIYKVRALPTIIFTDRLGKRVLTVPGYMKPILLNAILDYVLKNKWKTQGIKKFLIDRGLITKD